MYACPACKPHSLVSFSEGCKYDYFSTRQPYKRSKRRNGRTFLSARCGKCHTLRSETFSFCPIRCRTCCRLSRSIAQTIYHTHRNSTSEPEHAYILGIEFQQLYVDPFDGFSSDPFHCRTTWHHDKTYK